MSFQEKLQKTHHRLSWLELILLVLWVWLMVTYIEPGSFLYSLRFAWENPLLLFLNILPVATVIGLLYFITSNSFLSGAIGNFFMGILSYANLLKIDGRNDPLVPADITLLKESLKAASDYHLQIHPEIIALILLSSALFFFLAFYLRKAPKCPIKFRVIAILVTLSVFFTSFFTLYQDKDLYASFPVSNIYNVTTIFNELGFNYCFLYNVNLYTIEKPENYSAQEVEKVIKEYPARDIEKEIRPNVIMVMCEAFNDITANDAFTYSYEDNPLYGYWCVADSPNAVSGHIVVPNFGAGTANTEFDVLTGMQTNLISSSSCSALRTFHHDIQSLASIYNQADYNSLYFHPGESWFYNRDSALSYMGFQERIFIEDLDSTDPSDQVFLENLQKLTATRTKNGQKLFTYATSIQNHQVYTYDKYNFEIPKVKTSLSLSAEAEEQLSVYTYGVACSSEMLTELQSYLQTLKDPYLLIFFGDHLPALGNDYLCYKEIGIDPESTPISAYTAPFVIWANDAYADNSDYAERIASLDLPADGYISANYLGEITLELCNLEETNSYFRFLSETRREIPVIKSGANTEEEMPTINKLNCWQYYMMK